MVSDDSDEYAIYILSDEGIPSLVSNFLTIGVGRNGMVCMPVYELEIVQLGQKLVNSKILLRISNEPEEYQTIGNCNRFYCEGIKERERKQ